MMERVAVQEVAWACDSCLRRAHLIAFLAPRIAGLLDVRRRRPAGLLALDDEALIAAVAGDAVDEARTFRDEFEPAPARDALERARVFALCGHAHAYPDGLRALDDPPAVLFSTAAPARLEELLTGPAVAIVGTRRGSPYGLEVARSLGRGLGAAGVAVVSGLALGIDAATHRGCVEAGGPAIAVLAGGPDIPYPRQNRALYRRLCADGAVVSEHPPGARAFRWSFPARNRIMAGLAAMTVVVEASDPSGSLITAQFAQELSRTVGAVPGRVTALASAGSNALLRDGARVVLGARDVLDELYGAGMAPEPPAALDRRDSLEPLQRRVLAAIEAGERVDAIATATGLGAGEVRAALGRLEALGFLRRNGVQGWVRRA